MSKRIKKITVIQNGLRHSDILLIDGEDKADPSLLFLSQNPLHLQYIQRANSPAHMNMPFSYCQDDESLNCTSLLAGPTKNAILMSNEI